MPDRRPVCECFAVDVSIFIKDILICCNVVLQNSGYIVVSAVDKLCKPVQLIYIGYLIYAVIGGYFFCVESRAFCAVCIAGDMVVVFRYLSALVYSIIAVVVYGQGVLAITGKRLTPDELGLVAVQFISHLA